MSLASTVSSVMEVPVTQSCLYPSFSPAWTEAISSSPAAKTCPPVDRMRRDAGIDGQSAERRRRLRQRPATTSAADAHEAAGHRPPHHAPRGERDADAGVGGGEQRDRGRRSDQGDHDKRDEEGRHDRADRVGGEEQPGIPPDVVIVARDEGRRGREREAHHDRSPAGRRRRPGRRSPPRSAPKSRVSGRRPVRWRSMASSPDEREDRDDHLPVGEQADGVRDPAPDAGERHRAEGEPDEEDRPGSS